eukprot:TRINITY_DN63368_c0_g1_i1.p1 TRINITY_DN63368_c0_g1~~TRINITY_DN63368_c0_g1_i1.p1  ORF type:complete len:492 (-),score=30.06 TRINITY_DN63368_c0_g1_i1:226-1701(-)
MTTMAGSCSTLSRAFSLILVIAVPLLLAGNVDTARAACSGKVKKVIIIGAGMSGSTAANQILSKGKGCYQVTILEARDRVGGRMWSRTEAAPPGAGVKTIRAEMGAQWIQSATGNPIAQLARQMKLPVARQNGEEIQFTSAGKAYKPSGVAAAERKYQALLAKARRWANNVPDADVSMDAAFRAINPTLYLTPYVQSRAVVDFEFEFGGPLTSLSAWYYEDRGFAPPDTVVTNGYDQIPKNIMKAAVKAGAALVLNFKVVSVVRTSSGAVQVSGVSTQTNQPQTYTADVVIVTLPLGVLKAGSVTFKPALSARKTGAINRLGFGAVNKVFFFFNTTFWPANVDEYFIEEADVPANRGKWVDWVNLKRVWGQTALEGVAVGDYAIRMLKMTDAEAIADAEKKMRLMFPSKLQPHTVWLQRWNADPYALGSYSYAKVGVKGNGDATTDYATIAESEGNFLFAGEHTHGNYRSSVHGAYASGLRAARFVLAGKF